MIKLFDSHCHITDPVFQPDMGEVISRMKDSSVRGVMIAGIDLADSRNAVSLADSHPHVFASVGVHPHDAQSCTEEILSELSRLAAHPKVRAWGETGLDFNRMFSPRDIQEKWFIRQIEHADALDLPLIFHERDSGGRFLEILKSVHREGRKGVVHCFGGDDRELGGYLDLGYYIGITGILTIRARGESLRGLVRRIPADRLVVETDAPYLTPTPERNKTRRNEPAFVRTIFLKLAEVLRESPEPLSERIWKNTLTLFAIGEEELQAAR